MTLFVGDDWAEDHHDIHIQDQQGHKLAAARIPEGVSGIARLHELIATHLPEHTGPEQVRVCIETDQGPWVGALVAAGYQVLGVNPKQAARHREGMVVSGAKSDKTDAYALADMARTRHHQLRPVAGDSPDAAAVKVVARAHQTLIWERTRHQLRLRAGLREYFPAALQAYAELGLAAPDTLRLLALAPDPVTAARLSVARISTVLKQARRRDIPGKAHAIQDALHTPQLGQPDVVRVAYAATTQALVAVITTLNAQITVLQGQVEAHFGRHPDVEVYLSQPGLGMVLGGRVLAEFGDAGGRYADARSRKNYAGTSPLTRQSGKHATVHARFIHNNRLVDALSRQAQAALTASPGARAYYDHQRLRGVDHNAALRQLANRLVGILHGCLTTNTRYDETTAWSHRTPLAA